MRKKLYLVLICIFILLSFSGCGFKNYNKIYVDYEKQLNENEIKEYILKELREKYDETFEIELYSKKQLEHGEQGIDMYRSYEVEGGYDYIFTVTSLLNNESFNIRYHDAYYLVYTEKNKEKTEYVEHGWQELASYKGSYDSRNK